MAGIGEFVQEHPGLVLGGAVGIGLLMFMTGGANRSPVVQDTGLQPVGQDTPNKEYMTVEDFNDAIAQYDERLREYIDRQFQEGNDPNPDPAPTPYQPPTPGSGDNEGSQGPTPRVCPPGYTWSPIEGRCVLNIDIKGFVPGRDQY
jgi:hypothetical protein